MDPRAPKVEKPAVIQGLHEKLVALQEEIAPEDYEAQDLEEGGQPIGS